LATGLDRTLQACSELVESENADLRALVEAWPDLPEQVKTTVKNPIETARVQKK